MNQQDVNIQKMNLTIIHALLLSKATNHRRTKVAQDIPWNR